MNGLIFDLESGHYVNFLDWLNYRINRAKLSNDALYTALYPNKVVQNPRAFVSHIRTGKTKIPEAQILALLAHLGITAKRERFHYVGEILRLYLAPELFEYLDGSPKVIKKQKTESLRSMAAILALGNSQEKINTLNQLSTELATVVTNTANELRPKVATGIKKLRKQFLWTEDDLKLEFEKKWANRSDLHKQDKALLQKLTLAMRASIEANNDKNKLAKTAVQQAIVDFKSKVAAIAKKNKSFESLLRFMSSVHEEFNESQLIKQSLPFKTLDKRDGFCLSAKSSKWFAKQQVSADSSIVFESLINYRAQPDPQYVTHSSAARLVAIVQSLHANNKLNLQYISSDQQDVYPGLLRQNFIPKNEVQLRMLVKLVFCSLFDPQDRTDKDNRALERQFLVAWSSNESVSNEVKFEMPRFVSTPENLIDRDIMRQDLHALVDNQAEKLAGISHQRKAFTAEAIAWLRGVFELNSSKLLTLSVNYLLLEGKDKQVNSKLEDLLHESAYDLHIDEFVELHHLSCFGSFENIASQMFNNVQSVETHEHQQSFVDWILDDYSDECLHRVSGDTFESELTGNKLRIKQAESELYLTMKFEYQKRTSSMSRLSAMCEDIATIDVRRLPIQ